MSARCELSSAVEDRFYRLESVVEQVGEAMLAPTEMVERLAERVDSLAIQLEHQGHQVQQQCYQICAISDAVQNFLSCQSQSREELSHLSEVLQKLSAAISTQNRR